MIKIDEKQYKIELYTISLMLMTASADDSMSNNELEIIKEIIIDFFKIKTNICEQLINESYSIIEKATDIYEIASFINETFNEQKKRKLLYSIFEIAYSDKEFHYMERHLINQIANILNVNKRGIIEIKKEVLNNLI
tara:strand:- start:136 stop:546 length:411 start_codon:yes stop_codon:yes gene_type:complete